MQSIIVGCASKEARESKYKINYQAFNFYS